MNEAESRMFHRIAIEEAARDERLVLVVSTILGADELDIQDDTLLDSDGLAHLAARVSTDYALDPEGVHEAMRICGERVEGQMYGES